MDGYYGEPVADIAPAIWWRLYQGPMPVGYKRVIGDSFYYSRDAYCWKGREIPHDSALIQTELRDRTNQRIFHFDRILFKRPGRAKPMTAIALEDEARGTLLWFVDSGQIATLGELRTDESARLVAERRLGTIQGQAQWITQANAALAGYKPDVAVGVGEVLAFSASGLGGGALAFALSWLVVEGVGPVSMLLGAAVAQWAMFRWRARRPEGRFKRRWLLGLSSWVGLVGAVSVGVLWEVLHLQPGAVSPLWSLALAAAAGLAMLVVTRLTGDVVAWTRGGFEGELQKKVLREGE